VSEPRIRAKSGRRGWHSFMYLDGPSKLNRRDRLAPSRTVLSSLGADNRNCPPLHILGETQLPRAGTGSDGGRIRSWPGVCLGAGRAWLLSQSRIPIHGERVECRAMKCWECGEEVPEDVEKTTIGGEGIGRFVHATAFEAATFEHAFCPTCGAGLRRQVGIESYEWEPIAEDVDE